MAIRISINKSSHFPGLKRVEFVERKGVGHPDSLANFIAESACLAICNFFREKYKFIPRFNVNQVGIIGGKTEVQFGKSKIKMPARVFISGKSAVFYKKDIKLINGKTSEAAKNLLICIFDKKAKKNFKIKSEIAAYSESNKNFFKNKKIPLAEDTSLGIGFYPYTNTEKLTLFLSDQLVALAKDFPIGEDTKVMVLRKGKSYLFIISIAFIAYKIKNIESYFKVKDAVKEQIKKIISKKTKSKFEIIINSADDIKKNKAYITATGSAAEHDSGSLGRGNGISGLITPLRSSSMEVAYGKNPVYNIGKIYSIFAFYLAEKIFKILGKGNQVEVEIISRVGNPVDLPQMVNIQTSYETTENKKIRIKKMIEKEFLKNFIILNDINLTVLADKIINNKKYEVEQRFSRE